MPKPPPSRLSATSGLPAWLLDYHELRLAEFAQRLVTRLPARLGYAAASLYLHDALHHVLTLYDQSGKLALDPSLSLSAVHEHLMVSVAREGRLLCTDDVAAEIAARRLTQTPRRAYPDPQACIVPLLDEGRLQGVLNLCGRTAAGAAGGEAVTPPAACGLDGAWVFLGRCLHHARLYEQVGNEARLDSLTGLFNHRWMQEQMQRELRRCERFGGTLALLVIDINGLKLVNDAHGHAAGDCLLRHVGTRVRSCLRQIDGAARIGGDEFVVLLPSTDGAGAALVMKRIDEAIREAPIVFRGATLTGSASIGFAAWQPGWDAERLLEEADRSMYAHKRAAAPPASNSG